MHWRFSAARRFQLLRLICRKLRLHYTAETGVFVPVFATATADPKVLERAGIEYATVISLINEVENSKSEGSEFEAQVARLRIFTTEHVDQAERASGLFEVAEGLDLDWESLERDLINRRRELGRSSRG